MKVWMLKLREQVMRWLGIEIDLDKYDYVVDVNPVRNERVVYWRKDIVDSVQFPEYWYSVLDECGRVLYSRTKSKLPSDGYRVRNKVKESEIRRREQWEKDREEKEHCVAIFRNLVDKQGKYTELEMMMRMQEVLADAAPGYRIEKDTNFYRVIAKKKYERQAKAVVHQFDGGH